LAVSRACSLLWPPPAFKSKWARAARDWMCSSQVPKFVNVDKSLMTIPIARRAREEQCADLPLLQDTLFFALVEQLGGMGGVLFRQADLRHAGEHRRPAGQEVLDGKAVAIWAKDETLGHAVRMPGTAGIAKQYVLLLF
jgi:hypothetical protein